MIIAFPTVNGGLDESVVPNFGRAPTFTLVTLDDSTKEVKDVRVVQNSNAGLARGAGIQTASYLASLGINAIVAPSVGPNAYQILSRAGIRIYLGTGIVKNLVQAFVSGQLQEFQPGFGPGFGRGMGRRFW